MSYDEQKHIELLKRHEYFKNQGKLFYHENKEEFFEMYDYDIQVEEKIFWEQRYKLHEFMQEFLNKKIDGQEFCARVSKLRSNLIIATKQFLVQLRTGEVKDFQPNPKSKKLTYFLTFLFCYCDDFMEDYENEEFCEAIQNGFLNLLSLLLVKKYVHFKVVFH
jgi:hypothetical protein